MRTTSTSKGIYECTTIWISARSVIIHLFTRLFRWSITVSRKKVNITSNVDSHIIFCLSFFSSISQQWLSLIENFTSCLKVSFVPLFTWTKFDLYHRANRSTNLSCSYHHSIDEQQGTRRCWELGKDNWKWHANDNDRAGSRLQNGAWMIELA